MRSEEYQTKNLNIAAYLYTSGLRLVRTISVDGEVFFKFSPRDKAEEAINQYFSGTANVNPRDLFARLHDLKDLIFNQKEELK